jgi:uncharacterized membrane protein YheB (UPF0754 family)
MNKSILTNLLAAGVIGVGYVIPEGQEQVKAIGFFALSGAITNWLAIHMLFEKVPFLYGSGVIPSRFNEFKSGIKNLIMTEFFSDENVDRFFKGQDDSVMAQINFDGVIDVINYDMLFAKLIESIEESSFGGFLGMIGGPQALEPMRQPFHNKVRATITEMIHTEEFRQAVEDALLPSHFNSDLAKKIESIVDQRLDELTPQKVKEIVQDMIRQHLGWLVVWGGVFGGLIGLVMSLIT